MLKALNIDYDAIWKQRYRLPDTHGVQIARLAPKRGLAVSNRSGVYQLYAWSVPTGELIQLTHRSRGIVRGTISPDGVYIYYHNDQGRNEVGHAVRVSFEGGTPTDITPYLPLYEFTNFSFSHAGNRLGFTTITSNGFDVYCTDTELGDSPGQLKQLYHCRVLTKGPILSSFGEMAVIQSADRPGTLQRSLIAFDVESGQQVSRLSDEDGSVVLSMFSPLTDDMRVLGTTDRSGVKRPLLWNARTSERIDITLDVLQGEVVPVDWSPDGKRLLLCHFSQAVQHFYLYDLRRKTLKQLQHPHGYFSNEYFEPNGDIFAEVQDSIQPPQLVLLDGKVGSQKQIILPIVAVPPGHKWKSISFTSFNKESIQGWLGLPNGSGPFPTILEVHGGPESVQTESFSPASQCWLDYGFAYLTINYHGSTTFGRAFQTKIRGNIGRWELEDMIAACNWLVEQGIAHPNQVFLTGGSYGGYLTLLALGKRPDLWAGGIAVAAFGDYIIAYEDEAEMLKAYDRGLMGGTPQEKPEQYKTSSPITYVEQVKSPVLIIQGYNDKRCPPRSIEVYEARMKKLGKPIEVHWFNAGHGSLDVEQQIDHQERMLRFAYQVLNKRE